MLRPNYTPTLLEMLAAVVKLLTCFKLRVHVSMPILAQSTNLSRSYLTCSICIKLFFLTHSISTEEQMNTDM